MSEAVERALASGMLTAELLLELERAVREIRFGSIEIVIHEGRITQFERKEKVRFAERAGR
ncbi:MAG TPA: YezD family protein [Burkholderiales bacterium]|nr:YezD family protein [Burkholderiales bacterium]